MFYYVENNNRLKVMFGDYGDILSVSIHEDPVASCYILYENLL